MTMTEDASHPGRHLVAVAALLSSSVATAALTTAYCAMSATSAPTNQQKESTTQTTKFLLNLGYKLRSILLRLSGLEKKILVLLPPDHQTPSTTSLTSMSSWSSRSSSTTAATTSRSRSNSTNGSPNPIIIIRRGGMDIRRGIDTNPEQPMSLLMLFPGSNIPAKEYLAVARAVQDQALSRNIQLAVAIGVDMTSLKMNPFARWVLNHCDPRILTNLMQAKAEQQVQQQQRQSRSTSTSTRAIQIQDIYNSNKTSSVFQDMFLWGHSRSGGYNAMQAAYPSKFRALIMYGCSMSSLSAAGDGATATDDGAGLLSSYPKPTLTLMGERDGFLRVANLAEESQYLQDDIGRQAQCSRSDYNTGLQRTVSLRKPIVVLPELNHMQMTTGAAPSKTCQNDLVSRETTASAHASMAHVVVDFVQVHSSSTNNSPSSSPLALLNTSNNKDSNWSNNNTNTAALLPKAQDRLLRMDKITRTIHLQPFLRLTDPTYQSKFMCDVQRQLLHLTTLGDGGPHQFNFYEDDDNNPSTPVEPSNSQDQEHTTPDIIPRWHSQPNDFLYSKSTWDSDMDQISLDIVEQDPVAVSLGEVPQRSKTLAFKGRSRADILFNQNKYQEIRDRSAPTLMEMNQQTFHRVLTQLVTNQQRRRYLQEGKKLRFGPDVFVASAPEWVTTPICILKQGGPTEDDDDDESDDDSDSDEHRCNYPDDPYYLWQSPYTTTSISKPAPFGGAWYGKPLSPAQAYEWIVFDAFKPFR